MNTLKWLLQVQALHRLATELVNAQQGAADSEAEAPVAPTEPQPTEEAVMAPNDITPADPTQAATPSEPAPVEPAPVAPAPAPVLQAPANANPFPTAAALDLIDLLMSGVGGANPINKAADGAKALSDLMGVAKWAFAEMKAKG